MPFKKASVTERSPIGQAFWGQGGGRRELLGEPIAICFFSYFQIKMTSTIFFPLLASLFFKKESSVPSSGGGEQTAQCMFLFTGICAANSIYSMERTAEP